MTVGCIYEDQVHSSFRGTHRPPACSRRAGGKRAFERLPRDRPKELTQILRSAGEHVPRRWVLGEPKPADGPVFWWANNGRKSSCSPAARRRPRWFGQLQQASRRTFASFSPRILRRGFRREAMSQKVNYFGHWNGGQACPGL